MAMDLSPGPLLPRLGAMSASQAALITPTPQARTLLSCASLGFVRSPHVKPELDHLSKGAPSGYSGWLRPSLAVGLTGGMKLLTSVVQVSNP